MRFLLLIFLLAFVGCQSNEGQTYGPKPRMYPYVELPSPTYTTVTEKKDCGFTFRKSDQAHIEDRKKFFDQDLQNDCWFNLKYPHLDASIHFTYYPIDRAHTFDTLMSESFRMAYEHSAIASAIDEQPLGNRASENGMAFTLKGPVASPYQFFLTDTTEHFIRGALYFNTRPNPDSIAPVLDYIRTDLDTLIRSFRWVTE